MGDTASTFTFLLVKGLIADFLIHPLNYNVVLFCGYLLRSHVQQPTDIIASNLLAFSLSETAVMKGTEVPNSQYSSACDCTCVLTRIDHCLVTLSCLDRKT